MPVATDNEVLVRVRFTPTGSPIEVPLSTVLDAVFGSAQGTICFRGHATWQGLAPGIGNGLFLTSGGPNADVYWSPGGGYLAPAFTAFSISGQVTPLEVGATIAAGSKTFLWATSNPTNIQANSISIVDTTASMTLASGLADTGSDAITITAITNILPASQVWTISATNSNLGSFSLAYEVDWEFRVYTGTSTNVVLTANQIKALADSTSLQASFPGTYNYADSLGYKYFSYPDSMGSVSNFLDAVTGFPIDMATVSDNAAYSHTANGWSYALISVTNAQSVATNYRLYRTTNEFSGVFSMRVI